MMMYILTVAGLVALVVGGEVMLRGAIGLARTFSISPLIVGLTVVAFGTSAPELLVGITAALDGAPGITIGNVVGSNVANVWLVLGVPALLYPLAAAAGGLTRNTVVMLLATFLFMFTLWDGIVTRLEGIGLLVAMAAYLIIMFRLAQKDKELAEEYSGEVEEVPESSMLMGFGQVLAGCVGLALGADWLVAGASDIARSFGVSEVVIGMTMVALGTSLPELVTSVMAAVRRHTDVALGNVIGSNIFNILLIMGVTATIIPIPVDPIVVSRDMWLMLAASLAILPFVLLKSAIGRVSGLGFSALYVAFVAWQFSAGA